MMVGMTPEMIQEQKNEELKMEY